MCMDVYIWAILKASILTVRTLELFSFFKGFKKLFLSFVPKTVKIHHCDPALVRVKNGRCRIMFGLSDYPVKNGKVSTMLIWNDRNIS